MVSIRTARFNTQISAFCHFICAVRFLRQTATISLCTLHRWVFPLEALCSLCSTNWILKQLILVFQDRAVAQSVSRRPVTMEIRIFSQASPFEICGGQSGNLTGFCTSVSVFRCYFQSSSDLYFHLHVALIKTKDNAGDLWNSNTISEIWEYCLGKYCHCFCFRRV
jgi:hypothetical protein